VKSGRFGLFTAACKWRYEVNIIEIKSRCLDKAGGGVIIQVTKLNSSRKNQDSLYSCERILLCRRKIDFFSGPPVTKSSSLEKVEQ